MQINKAFTLRRSCYREQVLADSPVAYWPMKETSGTVMNEIIGGQNGTYHGSITRDSGIPGDGGSAIVFDGSTTYADFPNVLELFNPYSIETWVNGSGILAEVWPGVSGRFRYLISTAVVYMVLPTEHARNISIPALSSGWHHFVATFDGATQLIFVDGVSIGSLVEAFGGCIGGTETTGILGAHDSSSPTPEFTGKLGHCANYNTALSATRILAHYNAGR